MRLKTTAYFGKLLIKLMPFGILLPLHKCGLLCIESSHKILIQHQGFWLYVDKLQIDFKPYEQLRPVLHHEFLSLHVTSYC